MTQQIAALDELDDIAEALTVSPLLRIDRRLDGNDGWMVSGGHGKGRETFVTRSAALVAWLTDIGTRVPGDAEALAITLTADLSMSLQDASELVETLRSFDVLIPSTDAEVMRRQAAHWEAFGWRDAYDYHFAVRATMWDRSKGAEYEDALRSLYDDVHIVGPQPPAIKPPPPGDVISLTPALLDFDRRQNFRVLADAMLSARPMNVFSEVGIEFPALAKTLNEAYGVRFSRDLVLGEHLFRSYPSGGARHPVEVYVVARDVAGLPSGAYHFQAKSQELVRFRGDEVLDELDLSCFEKGGIKTASAVVFLSYRYLRHAWKYRYSRTYRMMLLEVGHAVQNTRLAASLAGLDVYENPAIDDVGVSRMLRLPDDADEGPLFAIGIGKAGTV